MPVLKDFRQTREIVLPSFPDSKVVIYDSLLVGDAATIDFNGGEAKSSFEILPKIIKSWNFTDESGKDLEINLENLSFLKVEDVTYLLEQFTSLSNEVKKKVND
jgi:hypothetical protein